MKIANTEKENLHIFQMIWEIPMKFSGKIGLMIKLKVIKKAEFQFLSREQTFEKFAQPFFRVKGSSTNFTFHIKPI